jgi:hypothetical protein
MYARMQRCISFVSSRLATGKVPPGLNHYDHGMAMARHSLKNITYVGPDVTLGALRFYSMQQAKKF